MTGVREKIPKWKLALLAGHEPNGKGVIRRGGSIGVRENPENGASGIVVGLYGRIRQQDRQGFMQALNGNLGECVKVEGNNVHLRTSPLEALCHNTAIMTLKVALRHAGIPKNEISTANHDVIVPVSAVRALLNHTPAPQNSAAHSKH